MSTKLDSGHWVFASMLFCGVLVVVAHGVNGEWVSFRAIEGLILVFLFLAILSTFAPALAGAFSILVLVVMSLSLAPNLLKKL
jgi:hypothetical protein